MVMRQRWPELVRVYQQDAQAGTQAVNKLANDAAKAAGFPSNMTRLVQEYILGKLAEEGVRSGQRESRAEAVVNHLLEADWHSDSEKQVLQKGDRVALKRKFWGHPVGAKARITSRHAPSPVNKYTGKMKLRGSPLASFSDKDEGDLFQRTKAYNYLMCP